MKLKFKTFFGSGGEGRSLDSRLIREFNLLVDSGESYELVGKSNVLKTSFKDSTFI